MTLGVEEKAVEGSKIRQGGLKREEGRGAPERSSGVCCVG